MDQWEFLLQQEGDRTWLPLESATVEILEGRYRVMAHSNYANTAVEVRISHVNPDQMPPKRRVLKRHHQTNPEGLIVVMPFTHLKPGAWDLRCIGGDLMNDMLGEGWQYSVQLQVMPQSSEDEPTDWDDQPSATNTAVAAVSHLTAPESEQQVEESQELPQPSHSKPKVASWADDILADVLNDEDKTPAEITEPASVPIESVSLKLLQTAYVLPSGRSITLTGQFQHPFLQTSQTSNGEEALDLSLVLHIYLRDPQTTELIKHIQHPLTNDVEQTFAVEIQLPDTLETRLVLGEAIVQSSLATQQSHVWATQAFTIAIALNELLEVIADQAEAQDAVASDGISMPLLPTESADSVLLPAEATLPPSRTGKLTLPETLTSLENKASLLPALGWTTPPQIYDPKSEVTPPSALSLPPLPSQANPTYPRTTAAAAHPPELPTAPESQPEPNGHEGSSKSPQLPHFAQRRSLQPNPTNHLSLNNGLGSLDAVETMAQNLDDSHQPTNNAEGFDAKSSNEDEFPTESDLAIAANSEPESSLDDDLTLIDSSNHQNIERPLVTNEGVAEPPQVFRTIDDDLDAAVVAQHADLSLWDEPLLDRTLADLEGSDSETDGDHHLTAMDSKEDLELGLDEDLLDPLLTEIPETSDEAKAQVESSFQSLNLQNRFWDRLNAFAVEGHQAASKLQSQITASEVLLSASEPSADNNTIHDSTIADVAEILNTSNELGFEEATFADEVVIYEDEPASTLSDPLMSSEAATAWDTRDENWVIPKPQVFLPEGHLKAGQQILIRVVLPDSDQRLYVKLWVSDRQTRTLVDEPRWLMYLEPNGQGYVETTLRVTVPMHCLELQISAIAVDMPTQRESERALCERRVIPADLPSLSLDEFDI